ncbi:MAG: hypothetical protein A2X97_11095 [Bdellovibrionales bacterium GWA1_52_35]|nr:MAG: hypothetical protein A2X97_11095 [Bdellovibrionales bacterium GWA1_52_35]
MKTQLRLKLVLSFCLLGWTTPALSSAQAESRSPLCQSVAAVVRAGDLLFIEIDNSILKRIARATAGWTNHVGMVLGQNSSGEWIVAESKLPVSQIGSLCKFVDRTNPAKIAVRRHPGLDSDPAGSNDIAALKREAMNRLGISYDLKFNFDNDKQYCSKFVYQIYKAALGIEVGQIETLGIIMDRMKSSPTYQEDIAFWTFYYGGTIPREQRIITPESQYRDPLLRTVLDNSNHNN